MAARRLNPAVREAERVYNQRRRKDTEYRAAEREAQREYDQRRRQDPEYRAAQRAREQRRRTDPATRDHVLALKRLSEHRRRAVQYGAETDGHTGDDLLNYWDEIGVYGCGDCGGALDDGYEIDHVLPLIRGGSDTVDNKLPLCVDCHASKVDRCPWEFYAGRYAALAPYLAPFAESCPRLSEDEIQARVTAYEARADSGDDGADT
ncbi:HNH endonuclease [Streptomyces massasporeus]